MDIESSTTIMAAFINRCEIFLQTSRRRKSFSSAPKRASVTRKCYACLLFMSRCIYFCGNKPFKGARHNVSARGVYQPVIYKIAAGLRWNVEAAFLCRFRNKNQTRAHIYTNERAGADRIVCCFCFCMPLVISSEQQKGIL